MWGLPNYLAHHWTRDGVEFAISGGRWSSGSIWTRQNNAHPDDNRSYLRTYAPQVSIAAVRKTLKKRRRFDAAARALGDGALCGLDLPRTCNASCSSIDSACPPPVGVRPTPAAGTTCSTGRGATGSCGSAGPRCPREGSRDFPAPEANGVASGSRHCVSATAAACCGRIVGK